METLIYAAMYASKGVNADRSVDAILSSECVDRQGDIIDQATWRLANFMRNPVVLLQHRHSEPIGYASNIKVVDGKLQARIHFATTQRADEVWQLFRDGALRAFSVGFRVGRVAIERVGIREVRRLIDCELFEVSAVSVPANPEAVVTHKALGLVPPSYSGEAEQRAYDAIFNELFSDGGSGGGNDWIDATLREAEADEVRRQAYEASPERVRARAAEAERQRRVDAIYAELGVLGRA